MDFFKNLDYDGLLHLISVIKSWFVPKEDGKGLSSNDYTDAEKTKLSGIATGATKNTVEDTLTSTSTTNALSANQGKVLDEKIKAINTNLEDLGAGDMLRSVYDTDLDGTVDSAENAQKLDGHDSSYYAKAADIPTVTNDLTNERKANYDAAYQHSVSTHAPANAEKNAIVTVKKNGAVVTPDSSRAVDIAVPTKYSDLTADITYLTAHQDISGKADKSTTLAGYGITNAYTKAEVESAIAAGVANAAHLKRKIVDTLPTADIDENTVYMVLDDSSSSDNKYIEWMYINGAWEKTGDTEIDLSGYVQASDIVPITNEEIDAAFAAT